MNKSYIVKKHIIAEIVTFALLFAALGIAIYGAVTIDHDILVRYGTDTESSYGSPSGLLSMPIIMLITDIIMSVMVHALPERFYNLPFKPKPGREKIMLKHSVSMIITMEFFMAVFSLGVTILMYHEKIGMVLVASMVLVLAMLGASIYWFLKMAKDNG